MYRVQSLAATLTFAVVAGTAYTAEAQSATTDCASLLGGGNLQTVFDGLNEKCCNVHGGVSSGNHRRTQGQGCVLDTCSQACARVFVPLMTNCQNYLPTNGARFSFISQIKGADAFLATCQAVLNPRPAAAAGTHWVHVGMQFLAADPGMLSGALSSGTGATKWGLWRTDPGSTGVQFSGIPALERTGHAPSGWKFNPNAWWVEEHGLIMENPAPLPAGKYQVAWLNRRPGSVPTVQLTVAGGGWSLDSGATLHDVTHMPCRSAKYTTPASGAKCVPDHVPTQLFPVTPGAVMPSVSGCDKLDYAVLFVSAYWG